MTSGKLLAVVHPARYLEWGTPTETPLAAPSRASPNFQGASGTSARVPVTCDGYVVGGGTNSTGKSTLYLNKLYLSNISARRFNTPFARRFILTTRFILENMNIMSTAGMAIVGCSIPGLLFRQVHLALLTQHRASFSECDKSRPSNPTLVIRTKEKKNKTNRQTNKLPARSLY